MNKYVNIKNIFFLFCIHIISHFLPFERATLGQDTFSVLFKENVGLKNFIINSDRPLMFLFGEIQKYIIENYIFIDFYLLVIFSFLPVLLTYVFLKTLLKNIKAKRDIPETRQSTIFIFFKSIRLLFLT